MKPKDLKYELYCAELAYLAYATDETKLKKGLDRRFDDHFVIEVENAMAFVGTKGKDAYVVFRGTDDPYDFIADADVRKEEHEIFGYVHAGFLRHFLKLAGKLDHLVHADYRIHIMGHSLGGAMSLMYWAWLIRQRNIIPYKGRSYGQPRVGGKRFNVIVNTLDNTFKGKTDFIQWVNNQDIVHQIPKANWLLLCGLYFRRKRYDGEVLYSHPYNIPKFWFNKKGQIGMDKPRSWKFVGSKADHSMIHYVANFKEMLELLLENYDSNA